jgi:hypothetical protein
VAVVVKGFVGVCCLLLCLFGAALPVFAAPVSIDQLRGDGCPLNGQWCKLDESRSWGVIHRAGEEKDKPDDPVGQGVSSMKYQSERVVSSGTALAD